MLIYYPTYLKWIYRLLMSKTILKNDVKKRIKDIVDSI